jgi:hypothetical protein
MVSEPSSGGPSQPALGTAAVLRGLFQNQDSGSALLISPVSAGSVWPTVESLGLALERIHAGPVLMLRMGFEQPENGSVDRSLPPAEAPDYSLVAGDLALAPLMTKAKGGSNPVVAEVALRNGEALAAISSPDFSTFLQGLRTKFRFVLLEGASLRYSAETLLASQVCDGVILGVRRGVTSVQEVTAAKQLASRANARVLGFVFEK